MITETVLNDSLKFLRTKVEEILATELGFYEILSGPTIKATVPSIWIEPPWLPSNYRVKRKSNDTANPLYLEGLGVEARISRETDLEIDHFIGGIELTQAFKIRLIQWDYKSHAIAPAILKLSRSKYWELYTSPRILEAQVTPEGFSYPQGTIVLKVTSFERFL